MNNPIMTARVPVGEYRCDFYDLGCEFVATSPQAQTGHYESAEGRHEHIRLVSDTLRSLQGRVSRLEQSSNQKDEEIRRNKSQIEELKKKLHRLEAHSLRVCSVIELSAADLLAPSPEWRYFQTSQYGYGMAFRARFQDAFCFNVRLRPTPHDRTLRWPFRSTLQIDVFPPDGHQHLLPGGSSSATLVPGSPPADQLRMLERPEAGRDGESESIEIRLPVGFSSDHLRDFPVETTFAARVALLPEEN